MEGGWGRVARVRDEDEDKEEEDLEKTYLFVVPFIPIEWENLPFAWYTPTSLDVESETTS